ncbi:MAG: hypothetical protein JW725_03965 [Candidatus Babeliaceae bacterium]|nr:hypothetical protein [Candidatus Babeliaceae bacterium]
MNLRLFCSIAVLAVGMCLMIKAEIEQLASALKKIAISTTKPSSLSQPKKKEKIVRKTLGDLTSNETGLKAVEFMGVGGLESDAFKKAELDITAGNEVIDNPEGAAAGNLKAAFDSGRSNVKALIKKFEEAIKQGKKKIDKEWNLGAAPFEKAEKKRIVDLFGDKGIFNKVVGSAGVTEESDVYKELSKISFQHFSSKVLRDFDSVSKKLISEIGRFLSDAKVRVKGNWANFLGGSLGIDVSGLKKDVFPNRIKTLTRDIDLYNKKRLELENVLKGDLLKASMRDAAQKKLIKLAGKSLVDAATVAESIGFVTDVANYKEKLDEVKDFLKSEPSLRLSMLEALKKYLSERAEEKKLKVEVAKVNKGFKKAGESLGNTLKETLEKRAGKVFSNKEREIEILPVLEARVNGVTTDIKGVKLANQRKGFINVALMPQKRIRDMGLEDALEEIFLKLVENPRSSRISDSDACVALEKLRDKVLQEGASKDDVVNNRFSELRGPINLQKFEDMMRWIDRTKGVEPFLSAFEKKEIEQPDDEW